MPSKNKFWKNQIHVLRIYTSAASTRSLMGEKNAPCKWCRLGTQRAWPPTLPLFSGLEQINSFLPTPDLRQSRCNMVRMRAKLLSCVWLFETSWTVAHLAPLSMGFSRQEYWSGLSFPSPGNLPNPGIKSVSPALQADSLPSEHIFFLLANVKE